MAMTSMHFADTDRRRPGLATRAVHALVIGGIAAMLGGCYSLPEAGVVFNYHGQLDQVLPESSSFQPAPESKGRNQAGEAVGRRRLEIDGSIRGGRLVLTWTYPESLYRRSTLESLAQDYLEALRAIIAHCLGAESGQFTPSDFPLAELDQDELQSALEEADFEEL